MRILAITSCYPRRTQPAFAPFNGHQFRALAAEHDLRVVVPIPWTERIKALARLQLPSREHVNADGIRVDHPLFYFPPRMLDHRWGPFYYWSLASTVEPIVREFRPQVILGCWAHPDGWAAVQVARRAGIPIVIKVIGSDVLVLSQNPLRRVAVREALREADRVVAVSQDLADHVIGLGVDAARVHVVYEGVDTDLFRPGDLRESRARLGLRLDPATLLFVGNLLLSKGAGVLVDACRRLESRGLDFRCYLVGQGRHRRQLRALIHRHGLEERVFLAGPRSQEELPDWYRAADLVILPSFSEGLPNVLREATMCGRPFVATRVGGIPEIADPSFSRLVAPGNVEELAEAVEEMLRRRPSVDPASARRHNITWKRSAALLADHLDAVVAGTRRITSGQRSSGSNKRLRVLVITSYYPRLGHETVAAFNRCQLAALATDYSVRIVAPIPWTKRVRDALRLYPRPRKYLNRDGLWVYHPLYFFPPRFFQRSWGQFYLWSIEKTVAPVVREFRPDVILGCWAHPDGWAAVRLGRRLGIPVVIKVHGSDVLVTTRHPGRRERVAQALEEADRVVTVSRDLAEHVARLGVDAGKVHVVYNGVDDAGFCPGSREEARARLGLRAEGTMLLFVGNLLLSKGAGVLIDACGRLADRGLDFQCHLVGQGRHQRRLMGMIHRHELQDRVFLSGPRCQEELPDWYRACDLVALPSFSEGIPNVLREATMCGRPFVATHVGGIPEIADPSFSRLVAPGDVDQLADAVQELLAERPLVDPARARRHNITWERSAALLAEHLNAVVAEARPAVDAPVALYSR